MNIARTIARKRDGETLSHDEIADLIAGYTRGTVPDYQMSAWAMAVYLRGMTDTETAALVEAMLQSGEVFPHTAGAPRVDKHSTGGIGDKASLTLAPALACCGVRVPMISGRGLGATGGTLDKLESIPGFRTNLPMDEAERIASEVGCVIGAASESLVPADRKLYALRDVTATVPSIPLITASIMSKKLAEGLDALVLDVKQGTGAFMKKPQDAQTLAESLVATGKRMGVATTALLTDMNQPLGRKIGNALEVDEAVECLAGSGPDDLRELTLALGGQLLLSAGVETNLSAARQQIDRAIQSGAALEKWQAMVHAQGGDLNAHRQLAPQVELRAEASGVVQAIDAEQLGYAVIEMGGGRKQLGDPIDFSVGMELHARLGDKLSKGDVLATLYARSDSQDLAAAMVRQAITLGEGPVTAPRLISGIVT